MSIVQNILGKSKSKIKFITKIYNNPKADGTYRICMHCETMFPISDSLSKAALCWNCALRVIKSGHYLGPHLTLPDYKHYPDFEYKTVIVADEPKPVINCKKKTAKGYGGGLCACGEEFERKTSRQKRCEKCIKESTRLATSARQRKYSGPS